MCALRKKTIKPQLVILDDKAIESSKRDDFDHKSIAKSLKSILEGAPTPSTIGLLANWGSGKTGIARLLKKLIKKDSKTAYIEFDVWKYEDEASIRRQFMYSMYHQLDAQDLLGKDSKLSDRLKGSVSSEVDDGTTYDPASLARLLILCTIIGVAIVVAILMDNALIISGTLIASVIGVVGIETFIKTGLKVFKNKKRTITQSRMTDADEFEDEFTDLVDKSKADKIIIVIDNLDRATDEKAVAILATIKSFLEYDKCIYIIPCDEDAVKKHLQRIFTDDNGNNRSGADADEFLRKFFNSYLRIPKFIDADLQDYTEKQLKNTNIHHYYPNIQNLATIITAAYRGNPRQIKQFINVFVSHFILALEREDQGLLPKGDISSKPEFLAKILIINQKWTGAYEELLKGTSVEDASKDEQYLEFLQASSLFEEPSNLKSFLYFKQSSRASNLPPGTADPLQTAIEDSKLDDVRVFIKQIQDSQDYTGAINQFILQLIEEASQKDRKQVIVNIINSVKVIWEENIIDVKDDVKRRIAKVLSDRIYPPGVFTLDIEFISDCLSYADTALIRNKVISSYISGIDETNTSLSTASENVLKTLELLSRRIDDFSPLAMQRKRFNKFIRAYFHDRQVLEYLLNHGELVNILDSDTAIKLSSSITANDLDEVEPDLYAIKSHLLNSMRSLGDTAMDHYIDSARILSMGSLSNDAQAKYSTKVLRLLFTVLHDQISIIGQNPVLTNLLNDFLQLLRNGSRHEDRLLVARILLLIRHLFDEAQGSDIKSAIFQFIKSNDASWTTRLLEEGPMDRQELFNEIFRPVYDTAINDESFAVIIWRYGNDLQKVELLDHILTHSPRRGLEALDQQINSENLKDIEALARLLLRHVASVSRDNKLSYYERLARINIGGTIENQQTAIEQIIQLSKEPDEAGKALARDVLNLLRESLSKKIRANMCKELMDWIESQGKLNYTFIPVLNLCFENFDAMNKSEIQRLFKIIFNQWLLQESDGQQILRARELALDNISKQELSGYIDELNQKKDREPNLTSELSELIEYIGSKN
ncbi:MAG: P-loop NTPase fold protein [Candidatus Microsaccharimonas sp.]